MVPVGEESQGLSAKDWIVTISARCMMENGSDFKPDPTVAKVINENQMLKKTNIKVQRGILKLGSTSEEGHQRKKSKPSIDVSKSQTLLKP